MVSKNSYQSLGVFRLLSLIIEGDRLALNEFLNARSIFSRYEKSELLLPELVELLRRDVASSGWAREADRAYDRTIDKFSTFPALSSHQKVDCRRYYQAVVDKANSLNCSNDSKRDECVKDLLNRFVYRHFWLSLKECRRNSDFTRYNWNINGSTIQVLMPRTLVGSKRAKWLNANVPLELKKAGEKHSIQRVVDEHFKHVQTNLEFLVKEDFEETDFRDNLDNLISAKSLAGAVSEEKADRLLEQRPAIRTLGRENLKRLIGLVFQSLDDESYDEGKIAGKFGISKATFSRFAGSRWKNKSDGCIPDLWRNVAGVLANNEQFQEACKDANVWGEVRRIVEQQ